MGQCLGGFYSLTWRVESQYALQDQLYLAINSLYTSGSYLLKAIVTQCIGKIFIATAKQDKSGTSFPAVHNSCRDR